MLPPVSATSFNQKVIERRLQTAIRPDPKGMICDPCKKVFTTENSYRSHVQSKKHREMEVKYLAAGPSRAAHEDGKTNGEENKEDATEAVSGEVESYQPSEGVPSPESSPKQAAASALPPAVAARLVVDEDATEEDVEMSIDAKIAASRQQIPPNACLFCTHRSADIPSNLKHMSRLHSFFIPDQEFLVDLPGLLGYLGEKLAIGNTCLYCPNGGKEFTSLEAVRAHMRDKAHCKVGYETEDEKLELSDFYDFESSYPDADERRAKRAEKAERRQRREAKRARKAEKQRAQEEADAAEGWEEVDDEGMLQDGQEEEEEDVIVRMDEDDEESSSEEEEDSDDEDDDLANYQGITLSSDGLSLRLPDGRTLGHRSLKVYYDQNLRPLATPGPDGTIPDATSAVTLKLRNVRQKLADPTAALIPVSGGFGGHGQGLEVMKARNAGEAKWAKNIAKQNREFRVREAHKTRVAIHVHNSQKHFRDPLLQ